MTIDLSIQEVPENQQESEVVLSVKEVSKKFCRDLKRSLLYGVQDIGAELIGIRSTSERLRPKEFWALNDVSFELRRGEALGLVGPNGSGKTTLLRIISGLIKPDTGSVEVKGRVAPLIALGAGFNPILTGRENIYTNMSILGLSKKEIDERFDAVLEFAEIGDAIDAPVQSYSSGMAARLGFASAIHTEPDILLIDEVLAVGDIKFRLKCYRKLGQLREKGTSFILVAHSSQAILSMCDRAIYLLKGNFIMSGKSLEVMNKYEADLLIPNQQVPTGTLFLEAKDKSESLGVDITYICFRNEQGDIVEFPSTGRAVNFCIGCKAHKRVENVNLSVAISDTGADNERVLVLSNDEPLDYFTVNPGNSEIQLQLPYCGLKPGIYTAKLSLKEGYLNFLDVVESFGFNVKSNEKMNQCSFYQPRRWAIVQSQNILMQK